MNQSSDTDALPHETSHRRIPHPNKGTPSNWREALFLLVESRIALIQIESKDVARDSIRRITRVVAALVCAIFAWAFLMAGSIALIAHTANWPWYWVALGAGGLHTIACLIFASGAKASGAPAFPVTRSEFQKDREWIENFHPTRKSKN